MAEFGESSLPCSINCCSSFSFLFPDKEMRESEPVVCVASALKELVECETSKKRTYRRWAMRIWGEGKEMGTHFQKSLVGKSKCGKTHIFFLLKVLYELFREPAMPQSGEGGRKSFHSSSFLFF